MPSSPLPGVREVDIREIVPFPASLGDWGSKPESMSLDLGYHI